MAVYGILDIDKIIEDANSKVNPLPSTENLGSLSADEIQLINLRIGEIAENEDVFAVLWSARKAIYDVVRAVKAKLKTTEAVFKGEDAEGKQIDIEILRPMHIKKSGTALTSWLQTVTAGAAYFESDTGDAKITLPDYEGRVYIGWVDPIDSPKLEAVAYDLSTIVKIIETPFELTKDFPVIRHKAIKILPGDSYRIQVRYNASGDDMARPVAIRAITAEKKEL